MAPCEISRLNVVRLLGPLRKQAARYRGGSVVAGDDLVVLTLQTAIAERAARPAGISIYRWLHSIMLRHLN